MTPSSTEASEEAGDTVCSSHAPRRLADRAIGRAAALLAMATANGVPCLLTPKVVAPERSSGKSYAFCSYCLAPEPELRSDSGAKRQERSVRSEASGAKRQERSVRSEASGAKRQERSVRSGVQVREPSSRSKRRSFCPNFVRVQPPSVLGVKSRGNRFIERLCSDSPV